jgi:hypothetical protein
MASTAQLITFSTLLRAVRFVIGSSPTTVVRGYRTSHNPTVNDQSQPRIQDANQDSLWFGPSTGVSTILVRLIQDRTPRSLQAIHGTFSSSSPKEGPLTLKTPFLPYKSVDVQVIC